MYCNKDTKFDLNVSFFFKIDLNVSYWNNKQYVNISKYKYHKRIFLYEKGGGRVQFALE